MAAETTSEQVQQTDSAVVTVTGDRLDLGMVDPDLEFIQEMEKMGGENFLKCYQCATCSGTCPISPDEHPFPRKEMVWAMWGLKDRLVNDPDIWLCHQCNDCSLACPRGGNPGDILAAVRQTAYRHFAFPGFMGTLFSSSKYIPVLFLIPIVILLAVLGGTGHLAIPEGDIVYSKFMPHHYLDPLFILVSVFAAVSAFIGAKRFWTGLQNGPRPQKAGAHRNLVTGLIDTIKEIAQHNQFSQCGESKQRYFSHMLTFYGFLALFVTTTLVFFGLYIPKLFGVSFLGIELPLPSGHGVKILGNLGALAFLAGTGLMLYTRLTDPAKSGKSNHTDWLFIGIMFGLAVTGILCQILRLADVPAAAYSVYFVHLVLILSMIGYFPYSKFAHLLYRTLGILYHKTYCIAAAQEQTAAPKEEIVQADAA